MNIADLMDSIDWFVIAVFLTVSIGATLWLVTWPFRWLHRAKHRRGALLRERNARWAARAVDNEEAAGLYRG